MQIEDDDCEGLIKLDDEIDEDEDADLGEEIDDLNDVPIEKPKCIEGINKMSSMQYLDENKKSPVNKVAEKMSSSEI